MDVDKEEELFASLIYLADSLVSDFDVVDLLDRLVRTCLNLFDVTAAGIVLADLRGSLRVLASSSEETRLLEVLEVQNNDGPCLEAFNSGKRVSEVDLSSARERWPHFVPAALELGIEATYAVPMRLRSQTIGALNLFCAAGAVLSDREVRIVGTLANMAAIGILSRRHARDREMLAEQLQGALNSRVTIEQAKGVIAERAGVDMGTAFDLLRKAARASRRPLTEIAADVGRARRLPPDLSAIISGEGAGVQPPPQEL